MGQFLCIGHRGASGHAPENTLKAFELAIQMGCPWVELDVYVVEGELVVIHDDEVDRTTNGTGPVQSYSLADLRSLDAGDGERIPTLKEVIDLCRGRCGINVELKGPNTAEPVNRLLSQAVQDGWAPEQFLISSFYHQELALADPAYRRGALFHKAADYLARTRALNGSFMNLAHKLVTPEIVTAAHDAGLGVLVYTVNTQAEMQALKDMGVDGVFTNYPDQFPNDA